MSPLETEVFKAPWKPFVYFLITESTVSLPLLGFQNAFFRGDIPPCAASISAKFADRGAEKSGTAFNLGERPEPTLVTEGVMQYLQACLSAFGI
jgi:hypothetical protein